MKVLILSCIMGEGHNSAANAVLEYLQKNNIECEVLDTLSLAGKNASKKAENSYIFSTKIPVLFGTTYTLGKLVSSPKRKSPVYYNNRKYRDQLDSYIKEHGFDTIVATHLFPAEALTALKRENRLTAGTLAIITDYTCSPMWEETELDYYVIPHKELIDEFVKHGMPEPKLLPYGIPIKEAFYKKQPKLPARQEAIDKFHLSLDTSKPWYLIMSGSMGFGKIGLLVNAIVNIKKYDIGVIIVCGNNQRLKTKLSFTFGNSSNVAVLGFVKEIPLLMDSCDVFFTKPGGLSSTEGAIKHIPMVHTAPIPGNEINNSIFFSDHGMSYSSKVIRKQLKAARMLCNDPAYRDYMIESQKETIEPDSCRLIYEALCNMQPKEGDAV